MSGSAALTSFRRPAALVVLVLATAFGTVSGGTAAGAASPSRQGWWKVGLPLADLGIGGLGNLRDPQGLDVPDGGLLVQGGPSVDQPAAYAAVAFDLGTASVSGPLRLVPAANAVSVPGSTLIACPLDDPSFTPDDGGVVADGPRYTCSSAVPATDDGGAYVFDVAGLRRGETLAVAILPSGPTDRVVFARPNDDTLPVTEAAVADDTIPLEPLPSLTDAEVAEPFAPDLGAATDAGIRAAPPEAGAAPAAALPVALPAAADRSARPSYAPFLVVTLLALAGVLWFGAGAGTGIGEDTEASQQ